MAQGIRLFLIAVLISVITACSNSVEWQLEDYTDRVARVLEQEVPEIAAIELPYQSARQNQLPVDVESINLLEFLKLNRCQLGRVVAQQNSALGKVAPPSQVMHFYRDFLIHGPPCVEALKTEDPKLADVIDRAVMQKQFQRMNVWWNAWTGYEEWQTLTSIAATPIHYKDNTPYLSVSLQALDFAIQQGRSWRDGQYEYDDKSMEEQLKQLRFSESIGRWLRSSMLLIQSLEKTAHVLDQRLKQQPLCVGRNDKPKSDILFNVFRKYYAGEVQPYLAKVHLFGGQISDRLDRLTQMVEPPRSFVTWRKQINAINNQLKDTSRRHVRLWQVTLSNCDLMPNPQRLKNEEQA